MPRVYGSEQGGLAARKLTMQHVLSLARGVAGSLLPRYDLCTVASGRERRVCVMLRKRCARPCGVLG